MCAVSSEEHHTPLDKVRFFKYMKKMTCIFKEKMQPEICIGEITVIWKEFIVWIWVMLDHIPRWIQEREKGHPWQDISGMSMWTTLQPTYTFYSKHSETWLSHCRQEQTYHSSHPWPCWCCFCQLRCEQKLSILPEEQKKNIVASFSISWQLVPYCLPHTVLSFFSLVKTVKLQAWKAARR